VANAQTLGLRERLRQVIDLLTSVD